MEKRLIVNADDYGHTASVSQGIRQAHLNGMVTSTSTMMNRPDAVEALRIAQKECPQLGLGLHLVLTTGTPLLPAEELFSLVDAEGRFYRLDPFLERINEIDLTQVEREWRKQLNAFKVAVGRSPDHLDSHHHISYATTGLFELMLTLAEEEGCAIRIPYGVEDTLFAEADTPANRGRFAPKSAQVFFGDFYDEDATLETLTKMVRAIEEDEQHSTFEMMCHPAVVDDELRRISVYNDKRGEELNLLRSKSILDLLEQKKINLIRYSDL